MDAEETMWLDKISTNFWYFVRYYCIQTWVMSTMVKMTLKTFEECVRLQTFNRGGYQQIQLDCHYLREPLQNLVENGTVVEIMLDEVSSLSISF